MNNQNINYITPRDIAEDARLNFEIEQKLNNYKNQPSFVMFGLAPDIQVKQGFLSYLDSPIKSGNDIDGRFYVCQDSAKAFRAMTMILCLTFFTLLPALANAESCTPTPDCKTLGYTQTSCPDGGGVKCPWDTSLMYCCKKCEEKPSCTLKTCTIGDVLYGDKKCYTCPSYVLPGYAPVGVIFSSGKAVNLTDLGLMYKEEGVAKCNSFSIGGVAGWYLPKKDELLELSNNFSSVNTGLGKAVGGFVIQSSSYWSSTRRRSNAGCGNFGEEYYAVNPSNANVIGECRTSDVNVRCVVTF